MSTERPILMSGTMIRALLEGRKTQTRRVVKPQPVDPELLRIIGPDSKVHYTRPNGDRDLNEAFERPGYSILTCKEWLETQPRYEKGMRLWVRETWAQNWNQLSEISMDRSYVYRADGENRAQDNGIDLPWKSSIFMPRLASRITLEITDVRVERLNDISEQDAIAEGCARTPHITSDEYMETAVGNYEGLWDSLNKKRGFSWQSNPWVFVIEFKRL